MTCALLSLRGISKSYRRIARPVDVLRGVDLDVQEGEFLALTGASGSGKSTLLHILGTLDRPTSGSYRFEGVEVSGLGDEAAARIRSSSIGFVFQSFHLVAHLDVARNVALPFLYARSREAVTAARVATALREVGLEHRSRHRPGELSGGEMQRVALARALVTQPRVIIADEPTGNLDAENGQHVLRLLQAANARGVTVVMVTHDPKIAATAARRARMADGRVECR